MVNSESGFKAQAASDPAATTSATTRTPNRFAQPSNSFYISPTVPRPGDVTYAVQPVCNNALAIWVFALDAESPEGASPASSNRGSLR